MSRLPAGFFRKNAIKNLINKSCRHRSENLHAYCQISHRNELTCSNYGLPAAGNQKKGNFAVTVTFLKGPASSSRMNKTGETAWVGLIFICLQLPV